MTEAPSGSIQTTPPRALAVAAVFGGLAGWIVVASARALGLIAPIVPWTAPAALAVVAALIGMLAYVTHQRIQIRHERVEPHRAVAFLVLGKASALAGAVVSGGYLGFALNFVGDLDVPDPRDRVVRSAVALLAGIGLAFAGLALERACRVPGGEDDNDLDTDASRA